MSRTLAAALVALLIGATAPVPDAPSVAQATGIPAPAVRAYVNASTRTGVPWQLIAGIGAIESGHGTYGGRTLFEDGHSSAPIMGPDLGGPKFTGEFARIDDSDGGQLDGRTAWDRAVGPMEFLPSTWQRWECDGDGDGVADPQDLDDAACATGRMLASHGDLTNPAVLRAAVLAYNNSSSYADDVIERMNRFTAQWPGTPEAGRAGGLLADLRGPVDQIAWPPLTRLYERVTRHFGITRPVPIPTGTGRIVTVDAIEVDASMGDGLAELLEAASRAGWDLDGWGYRTAEDQRRLREQNCPDPVNSEPGDCHPATARVGTSNHERGLAVDFRMADGRPLTSGAIEWLHANGPRYGFIFGIDTEAWHGSATGG